MNSAKKRNIPFQITIQQAWNLFLEQNRKCALSGVLLYLIYNRQIKENRARQTASLDRIDSSQGYIEGNVQWVHKRLNYMKQNLSDAEFIDWCKKVAKHNEKT